MPPAFTSPVWATLSQHAQPLLDGLLCRAPHQRMNAATAAAHPWTRAGATSAVVTAAPSWQGVRQGATHSAPGVVESARGSSKFQEFAAAAASTAFRSAGSALLGVHGDELDFSFGV